MKKNTFHLAVFLLGWALLSPVAWAQKAPATTAIFTCGNGRLDPGEECEGPFGITDPKNQKCSVECKIATLIHNTTPATGGQQCGNKIIDLGEECEGTQGITNPDKQECVGCKIVAKAVCGNRTVDIGEECDGPAGIILFSTEKCSPQCKIVRTP